MCRADARELRVGEAVEHQLAELAGAVADARTGPSRRASKPPAKWRRASACCPAPAAPASLARWRGRAARPATRWPRCSASARPACRPTTRAPAYQPPPGSSASRRALPAACSGSISQQRLRRSRRARAALRGAVERHRAGRAAGCERCSQPCRSWRSPGSVSSVVCARREVEAVELRRPRRRRCCARRRCSCRRAARSSPS